MCRRTTRTAPARWIAKRALANVARRRPAGCVDRDREHRETVLVVDDAEPPTITLDEAAVLVEALNDLFYQSYVRTAKLRAAMRMRRFFAGENAVVTPIDRNGWRELA
jgi:hypothetical protein